MQSDMKTARLQDVAEIRSGYPFREIVRDDPKGAVSVIQVKNADEVQGIEWGKLAHTNLIGRRTPDWLESGDILFAARGHRNFAVCLDEVKSDAVCSPHFFKIHVTNSATLRPDFLAWYINQSPAQQYFAETAEGSRVRSIRRGVLELLTIAVPPVSKQAVIAEMDKRIKQEHLLLQQKMNNSRAMMNAIARDLINQA